MPPGTREQETKGRQCHNSKPDIDEEASVDPVPPLLYMGKIRLFRIRDASVAVEQRAGDGG